MSRPPGNTSLYKAPLAAESGAMLLGHTGKELHNESFGPWHMSCSEVSVERTSRVAREEATGVGERQKSSAVMPADKGSHSSHEYLAIK
jgi:hypothetical protein